MNKFGKFLAATGVLTILSQGATFANSETEPVSNPEFYVLREWNGKIALLEEGGDEPLTVYNTEISSLYPADAKLLREGIRVKTRFEVARLIEDLDLD